jgi:hypothetical protein
MIYPEISIEDIKKWNYIGGKDSSIIIDDKKIYLDEDQYSFSMFLALLDRESTSVIRENKFKTPEPKYLNGSAPATPTYSIEDFKTVAPGEDDYPFA